MQYIFIRTQEVRERTREHTVPNVIDSGTQPHKEKMSIGVCMYVVCMYVCMYAAPNVIDSGIQPHKEKMSIDVCMYAVCTYECMYVCMYVYTHVCMYVRVCVCMYVHTSRSHDSGIQPHKEKMSIDPVEPGTEYPDP